MTRRDQICKSDPELADLRELQVVLVALKLALARQRAAIAALDVEELAAATAEKRRLGDEVVLIQSTLRRISDTDENCEIRSAIKRLATEIRCSAQANAVLMSDARTMIGHVLGTETVASGYDRRARRYSEPRAALAKAL